MKKTKKLLMSVMLMAATIVSAFTITSTDVEAAVYPNTITYGVISPEQAAAIRPIFDAKTYASLNDDVRAVYGNDEEKLWAHFITCGMWEHRQPSHLFNVDVYASANPDLQQAFGDDLVAYYVHYATSNPVEKYNRAIPTLAHAYITGTTVYSVSDFVKGQKGPKAGTIPLQSPTRGND